MNPIIRTLCFHLERDQSNSLITRRILNGLIMIFLMGTASLTAHAQPETIPHHKESRLIDSGTHDNLKDKTVVAFSETITAGRAPWMRLHISKYNLGTQSYITITSLKDGGFQRLDAKTLPQWGNASAFFTGGAVEIELHVGPGERGVFVRVGEITIGEYLSEARAREKQRNTFKIQDLCFGDDDRVASNDPRVGRLFRLGGCTAWLVSNGALLTAGHCADIDPDAGGPLPIDGVLDWNADTVVGFNVPPSLSDGTAQPPDPNDQYPIDLNSVRWEFFGSGISKGRDWAVFRCLPNSTTLKTPQQVQNAFFRMTDLHPQEGASIRITGYGLDNAPPGPNPGCDVDGDGNPNENCNAQSKTQQTASGNYVEEDDDGSAIWHVYHVDTMPGNSGGPIIWENNGLTIGIHTNSSCADGPGNSGTSFERPPLELALQVFPGQNVNYVDKVTVNITQNGGIYRPFHFVTDAVNHIQTDVAPGIISIVAGSYKESLTINKRVTLIAPVGKVVIGQ
jgi:hypothetical protein